MRLTSRILICVSIVFLALMSGATARPAVDHVALRDRAPAPSKPSGLTVVSRTSSSLGIRWKASARGVSYGVYRGSKRVASTTATTYTFRGLKCATSYRVGVTTVRAGKRSAKARVSATTRACPSPPPRRLRCFESPGACGYPDPAYRNVGVPAGRALRPSGSISVTTDGTVIDGLDVAGTIRVNARNVTIKNTRVTVTGAGCGASTCGNWAILVGCACTVTISNVELTANAPTTVEHGIRNANGGVINLDHVYQHGNIDALCWCGNSNIRDSYSLIYLAIANDHLENLYIDDHSLTAIHNTFLNKAPQTANIFGNTDNGTGGACKNQLTITDNLFAGGGYTIYPCGNATSVGSSRMDVQRNRFARCKTPLRQGGGGTWFCTNGADSYGYYPRGGSFGHLAASYCNAPGQTWIGNVWDDNNATVDCR